jgi:hypothetical protein
MMYLGCRGCACHLWVLDEGFQFAVLLERSCLDTSSGFYSWHFSVGKNLAITKMLYGGLLGTASVKPT